MAKLTLDDLSDVSFALGWGYAENYPDECDGGDIDSHLSCSVWSRIYPQLSDTQALNEARAILRERFEDGVRAAKGFYERRRNINGNDA